MMAASPPAGVDDALFMDTRGDSSGGGDTPAQPVATPSSGTRAPPPTPGSAISPRMLQLLDEVLAWQGKVRWGWGWGW
jgi:hypothetical protein